MSNSGLKYGSGKNKFIGSGIKIDRNTLAPGLYTGSVIFSDDLLLYYSNGDQWVQLVPPIIRRPVPIDAITPSERRSLRITPFVPGPGYESKIEWVKTRFTISYNSDMSSAFTVDITDPNYKDILSIDRPPNDAKVWDVPLD